MDHVRRLQPDAEFTVGCGRLPAPIFEAMPDVKRVLIIDKEKYATHWWKVYANCRGTKWDWIIDLRNVPILRALRAARRDIALTRDKTVHKIVELCRVIGEPPIRPHLTVPPDYMEKAKELYGEHRPNIAIAATAANLQKEWSPARFAALVDRLASKDGALSGARLFLFGAPNDKERLDGICDALRHLDPVNMAGKTNVLEAAAYLSQPDLFIGNDSGLMHIAAAMNTPTIGIFGSGEPVVYGPWGDHTRLVYHPPAKELAESKPTIWEITGGLMSAITIDEVHTACLDLLNATR